MGMCTIALILIFIVYLGTLVTLGVFIFISMVLPRVFLQVLWAGSSPPLWPVLSGKPCISVSQEFRFEDEGDDAQANDTVSSYLWTESPLLLWKCFMQGSQGTWLLWLCSCHPWGAPCLLAASDLALAVLKSCRVLHILGRKRVARRSHTSWYIIHASQSLSGTREGKISSNINLPLITEFHYGLCQSTAHLTWCSPFSAQGWLGVASGSSPISSFGILFVCLIVGRFLNSLCKSMICRLFELISDIISLMVVNLFLIGYSFLQI